MGLFSQRQMDDILSIAKKSKAPTTVKKPKVRGKGITAELQRISDEVIAYFKDSQARLITTQEELHDYITNMIAAGIGAIDTETTGLDRVRDTIVGFSLYYPGDVEVYIPCNHIIPIFEEPYSHQVSYEQAQVELQRLVEAKTKLVFANADFDLGMIFKDFHVDLLPCFFYDVILAWRCLKEDERDNALKVLYNKYVLRGKGDPKKFSDFFSPTLFPYCKPEVAKLYAANDAKITYELFIWQRPYVTKNNPKCKKKHFEAISDLVWNVEFPMVAVAQRMHRRGMYIEKEVATMLRRKYHRLLDEAKQKLVDLVQECLDDTRYHARTKRPFSSAYDFNPNSTPHVKWLCYDFLGLDGGKKDATGKEILSTFGLPVTNQILYVRSLVTLIGTFVDKMPDTVASDEKLHCTFKVIGADCVTGDTLIPTSNGYHYMRNLCIRSEDNVGVHLNYDKPITIVNKDQVSEDAVSCICFKGVKTIKLNLAYGLSIEGTPNHPVMVSQYTLDDFYRNKSNKMYRTILDNKHFKTLDTIKVGDLLEIPCNFDCGGSYQKTGLHLVDYRNITGADPKVPEYYDEAFAEWLGMYHADGTCMYKSGTYRIALHNCNTDVISRFSYLTKHIFNVTPTLYVPKNRKNQASSYICCMGLSDMDRILKKGANQKKIPDAIYHSPRSVINAYIRGMTLDSSVSVSSKPNRHLSFELTVTNDDDVRLIQQHLLSQGILSSIVRHNYRKDGSVLCRLKFSADHYTRFVETIGFIETDKIHYGCRNKKNPYAKIRYGNSFVVRVKSIEYKTNDVYDFHVPETHSFISNGVISHNTGRMSSADPNLQNVPSKQADIRHMFRAMPGNVLMSSDYSQQEPKLTAYISQDENMIKSFQENKDIYSFIAAIAFNKTYDECLEFTPDHVYNPEGKARRTEAKSVVLGILYGRSTVTIADQLYSHEPWSQEKKIKQAQFVYDSVLKAFPALKRLMDNSQAFVRKYGYTETILGRRRHIPDMQLPLYEFSARSGYVNPDIDPLDIDTLSADNNDIPQRIKDALYKELTSYRHFGQVAKRIRELDEQGIKVINNKYKIQEASRQVVNSIIQGSAADTTKMALLNVENDEEIAALGGKIVNVIHDEILLECPIENKDRCAELLAQRMCEAAGFLPFPIKCDVEITLHWYGLPFPCEYEAPTDFNDPSEESVKWLQWHIYESGYELPVYKNPDGSKPEGVAAKGVNGRWSDELANAIDDYKKKHHLDTDEQFLKYIHEYVYTGIIPDKEKYA